MLMFSMKRLGAGARVAVCSAMVALSAASEEAYAQIDGNSLLNAGTDTVKKSISPVSFKSGSVLLRW